MGRDQGKRVAVIGAGPAGLAAGRLLRDRGVTVDIYEKASAPGGRSGCDAVGSYRFDRGAEFVASFYPRTLRLIREHGLASQLSELRLEGDILIDGRRAPLPVTPGLLLRTPLLSWRTKLRLLARAALALLAASLSLEQHGTGSVLGRSLRGGVLSLPAG